MGGCELKGSGGRARGVVVVFLDNRVLQLLELEMGNFQFLVVLRTVRAAFVGVLLLGWLSTLKGRWARVLFLGCKERNKE